MRNMSRIPKHHLFFISFILTTVLFIPVIFSFFHGITHRDICEHVHGYDRSGRLLLNSTLRASYPKYSLHYYTIYGNKSNFTGIPVLFIHGHAGDLTSGAALAEMALEFSNYKSDAHFDFFLVDFNEEYSAFYGKFLQAQTEFSYECVKHILGLYRRQQSLVVFAFSMGGVVAMGMPTVRGFDPEKISLMILMGSPQQMPVTSVESGLCAFYGRVHARWKDDMLQRGIPIVSLGGGEEDTLVRAGLTSLSRVDVKGLMLWSQTTSIPGVWKALRHLDFIWCREMLNVFVKCLHSIIDHSRNHITSNTNHIRRVFRLSFNPERPYSSRSFAGNVTFPWKEVRLPWILQKNQVGPYFVAVQAPETGVGLLVISNTTEENWLWSCKKFSGISCEEFSKNFHSRGFIVPSQNALNHTKFIHLSPEDTGSLGHLVVHVPSNSIHLQVETLSEENELLLDLSTIEGHEAVPLDGGRHTFYNISLDGFTGVIQAYTVKVDLRPSSCKKSDPVVFRLYVPWSEQSVHYVVNESQGFELVLNTNRPQGFAGCPQLQVFILSGCSMSISIKSNFFRMIHEFNTIYLWYFISFVVLQILILAKRHHCRLIISESLHFNVSLPLMFVDLIIIPVTILWKMFSQFTGLKDGLLGAGFPEDDIDLLQAIGVWSPGAFLFSYFMSLVFVLFLGYLFEGVVLGVVRLSSFLASKMPKRSKVMQKPMVGVHFYLPPAALVLGFFTCGAVALLLLTLFTFVKVCMTQRNLNLHQYNLSLFLLSLFHFILNFMIFRIWAKTEEKFQVLEDPTILHGVIACLGYFLINSESYATSDRKSAYFVFIVVEQVALFPYVVHCSVSIYLVSYFIDWMLVVISCHVLASRALKYYESRRAAATAGT